MKSYWPFYMVRVGGLKHHLTVKISEAGSHDHLHEAGPQNHLHEAGPQDHLQEAGPQDHFSEAGS